MATRTQGRGGAAASKKAAAAPQPQGAKGNQAGPEKKQPFADEEQAARNKLADVNKKLEDARAKITALRAQINDKDNQRKALIKAKTDVQQALRDIGTNRKQTLDAKKALDVQIQQAIQNIKNKTADIEKYKDRLPFKNEKSEDFAAKNQAFIEKEIKKYEDQLNSTSMSLSDEKKVVAELNQWKGLRTAVRDFDVREEVNKLGALRAEVKTFHAKLDAFTGQEDSILKKLEEANNKVNESLLASQGLIKQLNAEFAKIDTLQEQRAKIDKEVGAWRQKRAEENQRLRKVYEEEREKRQKQYEEDKLRRQQEFLDRERKRQEERDAQEVLKVPYEEELALCDNLIGFLNELSPVAKKRNPNSELKIQWEVYLSFEHLSLVPPRTPANIDASLVDLKAKKEHFQRLSNEKIEQRKQAKAQKAEEKAKEESTEKPKEEAVEEKKVEEATHTEEKKEGEEAQ